METSEKSKNSVKLVVGAIAVVVILIVCVVGFVIKSQPADEPEILTTSTLQKIVDIEELSTYEATYNGVAIVYDEKNPENIDYYVAYKAKVKTGVDFDEIDIEADSESKSITVTIPTVKITSVDVDIASLEYIFYDDKANTSGISEIAYKACIADVEQESQKTDAIFEMAQQNAESTVEALLSPFVEDMDSEYTLNIKSAS